MNLSEIEKLTKSIVKFDRINENIENDLTIFNNMRVFVFFTNIVF